LAARAFGDQFDACCVQGFDQFHEGVDCAAYYPVARFHALDGRQRKAGEFREAPLIDLKQGAGGAHLGRSNHVLNIDFNISNS
jgi:hypothetical protein